MPDPADVAQALQDFGCDPQRGGRLASVLGFTPLQLGGAATPLRRFFEARTDVAGKMLAHNGEP
jgi:hypothetical protein